MALNTWINPLNKVSLTGSVDITADSIRLIVYNEDAGQEEITNVLSLFLMYDNISVVEDVNISLGGGQYYTIKQWVGTIDDNHIPGLQSLIDYLQANYRAIDDVTTGPAGADGVDGAVGAAGAAGATGATGPAGNDGNDGVDGAVGATGATGAAGAAGANTINKTQHDTINTYNDYNYNKTVQQTIKSFKSLQY